LEVEIKIQKGRASKGPAFFASSRYFGGATWRDVGDSFKSKVCACLNQDSAFIAVLSIPGHQFPSPTQDSGRFFRIRNSAAG
jgi:hypothetical protein